MSFPLKNQYTSISYKDAKPLVLKCLLHCWNGVFIFPEYTVNTTLASEVTKAITQIGFTAILTSSPLRKSLRFMKSVLPQDLSSPHDLNHRLSSILNIQIYFSDYINPLRDST